MTNNILIVEDDAHLREWLAYELETEGYHTTVAAHSLTGLQAAQDQQNLILLDVQLPGMNGFEICQILQSNPDTVGIPVIFLTARTTVDDKLSGFEAGGIDYMTKPFTIVELKARVKTALHRHEVEQQRAQASLERYKKHLSQNMSHELLTPMTIILNALDVLDHTVAKKNSIELEEIVNMAQTGANRLHWLIQDMLAISKIIQNRMPVFRQPVELRPIVKLVLEQLSLKYESKALEFSIIIPEQCTVYMMSNQVREILRHLLDNACKFSPVGEQVELIIKPVGQTGVEIFVRDKGIGIEPDQQECIFDKFYQVDMSITRPVEGMGLGLYIARTLAQAYDGDVTVESKPGQGATFCFSLPDDVLDWAEGEEK